VPKILVFSEHYGDEGEEYTGKREWKGISSFATKKMQNFVSIVSEENFENFIERDPTKYKVLIFTERKSTAPLYKALSKSFKDKLLFGEIRSSEASLVAKFSVS